MSNKDFFRMDFRVGKDRTESRLVSDKQKLVRLVEMSGEIGEESDPTVIKITFNGPKSNVDDIMDQIGFGIKPVNTGDICTSKFKTITKQESLFEFIDEEKQKKREAKKAARQTKIDVGPSEDEFQDELPDDEVDQSGKKSKKKK